MKKKELIVNLIQQDLKHNQLVGGLGKIGLDDDGVHSLEILETVSNLMNVTEQFSDRWSSVYNSFMEEATHCAIEDRVESLKPLAEMCYRQLKASLDCKPSS